MLDGIGPLFFGFVLNPHTTIGYGDGYSNVNELPFLYNFYAGGIGTLPGYSPYSLGPKYNSKSSGVRTLGGNFQVLGGINLILPNLISDRVRIALFLDFGNIFDTKISNLDDQTGLAYESVTFKNLRVTTGLLVSWLVPLLGPVDFSVAAALNKKHIPYPDEPGRFVADDTQVLGFTFGVTF